MTRAHAEQTLREFENAIRVSGYERADKHKFAVLLGDLIYFWSKTFDHEKAKKVRAIEEDWQRDRLQLQFVQGTENPIMAIAGYAGAGTIASIIERTRALVAFLPTESPKPTNVKDLSFLAARLDMRAFVD